MLPLKEQWKFGRKLGKSILDHISILRPILLLISVSLSLSPSTRPSIWGVSFCLRFFENLNSFKHSNTGNSVHCLSYPPNEPRIVKCGQEVEPGPPGKIIQDYITASYYEWTTTSTSSFQGYGRATVESREQKSSLSFSLLWTTGERRFGGVRQDPLRPRGERRRSRGDSKWLLFGAKDKNGGQVTQFLRTFPGQHFFSQTRFSLPHYTTNTVWNHSAATVSYFNETTYPNWIQFGLGIGLFRYSTEMYKIPPTGRALAVGRNIGCLSSCRPS